MKKIFTFLICFGLFSSAFAQQRDRRNSDGNQSSPYSGDAQYNKTHQYQTGDRNDNTWSHNDNTWSYNNDGKQSRGDRDDANQYSYNHNRHDRNVYNNDDDDDRNYGNRNHSRYDKQRGGWYPQPQVRKPSILQIILGITL